MSRRKILKQPVSSLNDMPTLKTKDKEKFVDFKASQKE